MMADEQPHYEPYDSPAGGWGAAAATNEPPTAVWDSTARVTTGFGYSDNVMRTSIAPESSGFFNIAGDASFIRFAESGAYLTFFALGDYTKYFDAPSVGYEAMTALDYAFRDIDLAYLRQRLLVQ